MTKQAHPKSTILVLYQDIDSGAKVATEAICASLKKLFPNHRYIVYKQSPHTHKGAFSFLRNLIWSINDFYRVCNKNQQADVVYSALYTSAIAHRFSKIRQTKHVFHLHGDQRFGQHSHKGHPFSGLKRIYAKQVENIVLSLQRYAVTHSDVTVFVSEASRKELLQTYALREQQHKTLVVPNGVDHTRFFPITTHDKKQLRIRHHIPNQKTIAYVGRIDPKKGIHHLVSALEYVEQNTHLLIVHPSVSDTFSEHYYTYLQQLVARKKMSSNVLFIENPKNIAIYYQLADCVVLPSKQEMMPLVMLESLATGTPFLISRVGVAPDLFKNHPLLKNHLLLPNSQPRTIARSVSKLFSLNPEQLKQLKKAELHIARQYTWEKTATTLMAILLPTTQQK